MSTADGSVLSTTKVLDHGSDAQRFNLVFLSDGYRSTEMTQYEQDVDDFIAHLFTVAPFDELDLRCAFNIYRINVSSTDSGADDPVACGGTGATAATYFDGTFCADGVIQRLTGVNSATVIDVLNAQTPAWDQAVVLINSAIRGGSGGQIATASRGGADWMDVVIHEMGHSAFGLADEYEYWEGCASGETDRNNHPAVEPTEPNVTIDSNRATIKWGALIAAATPMPTTSNANCAQCDTQASPVAAGTVGAFEGAHYFHCDAFRPEFNCMMRDTGQPFCAVCVQQIRSVLAPFASPTTVTQVTPSVVFNDVPEGVEAPASAVFSLDSCLPLTFQITSGPTVLTGPAGTTFNTPLGLLFTSAPTPINPRQVNVWITYRGTNDGDIATGTMTVRCLETGVDYVIPITANTVDSPTAAVVLALDQSGSMDAGSGIPGFKRIDVLRYSAPPFVDLIPEGNAIGIVRFDHDAYDAMPVTGPLGPPGPLDPPRLTAKGVIAAHVTNPAGFTAIGDGLEKAHAILEPVTGYDIKATIVLTDGHETDAKYIADVAGLINERVYAIGLGTADQIQPAALTALTNGTGGYLLMTGEIGVSEYFRLTKYYLQILAGVTNADIVLDPEGTLPPGVAHRIPFQLNETDIYTDVIALTPSPGALHFAVETPAGEVIDPSTVAPGVQHVRGEQSAYYRIALPALIQGTPAREGTWHALLKLDEKGFRKYLSSLDRYPGLRNSAAAHGLRYSINVHAYSNLRMRSALAQSSMEPGATLTLRVTLTEYGLPMDHRAQVRTELTRPDGSTAVLALAEVQPGIHETTTTAVQAGIYTFVVKAQGSTLRGRPFTREQVVTGAVWKGGDDPNPHSDPADDERWCRLLRCLLSDNVMTEAAVRHFRDKGIDLVALRKCVEILCRERNTRAETPARSTFEALDPAIRSLLLELARRLAPHIRRE
jgi:hypothetical protein